MVLVKRQFNKILKVKATYKMDTCSREEQAVTLKLTNFALKLIENENKICIIYNISVQLS